MASIGIVGSGIAGLQLGLGLRQYGIDATIYSDRTPEQQLSRPLSNIVLRNACTRERERQLGVDHWDSPPHDVHWLSLQISGPQPLRFSGAMGRPAHSVDMRIYWARLLEDFSVRGGRVVIEACQAEGLERLANQHDLLVIASGRAHLATMFQRLPEHSPYTTPQRLVMAGVFRGIAYSEPRSLEIFVTPGSGEILTLPIQSFEPDVTGIGILITAGGKLEVLRHLRYEQDPRAFVTALLGVLREHAPTVYERIDQRTFDVARPSDLGYAAITPTVRRGFAELSNGRPVVALGDAHVVIDPVTGQGANNASHAAAVLCHAIRHSDTLDQSFCRRVEQAITTYVLPVSDACNARLQPPTPHFRQLLIAATQDQAVADVYASAYNHPDRFWAIASSPERTASFLDEMNASKRRPTSSNRDHVVAQTET
jgi:2-polyprenyl-6-methoxyphenol hydroxylase-like FAD-dependent oxidoreductase